MICQECLKQELKRLPKLIKAAMKDKAYSRGLELAHEKDTLEWVLGDDDCQRYKPR